jgi:hypothetical protein
MASERVQMIEVNLKYLNRPKFELYANELCVKHNISLDLIELNHEHCRIIIDGKEEDVKELIKDRLVLYVTETTNRRRK